MSTNTVITHAHTQGGGVSLVKATDAPTLAMTGVIVSRSGFLGSFESRVLTSGGALRLLEAEEGPVSLTARVLAARYVDVVMDDRWDDFTTWSARSVTALPVMCSVDHDGGFTETV